MNKIPSLLALFMAFVLWSNSTLATTFTVSNLSRYDSWQLPVAGSLRKALEDAAAAGVGPHSIVFDFVSLGANPVFTFTGDEYINNTSSFALAGTNVTLDGLTGRPGGGSLTFTSAPYAGNAVFVMKGTSNTVKGITFTETTNIGYGLLVTGSGHTVQQNNFVNGTGMGLRLNNTTNAVVQNNLIENNAQGGMYLDGSNTGALVGGCAVGNSNTIIRNGNSASTANDDVGNGITLGGQFATCTATAGNPIIIRGNYVGTTSSFNFQDGSSNFLGNSHHGISIWQSSNVTVGGTCPNYVCNNGFRRIASGVSIYASNTVTVDNNVIGTDGTTGKKLGNDYDGITINAAANNTITNNIIGNSVNGIGIRNTIGSPGVQPIGNIISNNKIGVDNLGNFISTSTAGISIEGNATTTLIQINTIKASGSSFSYGNGKTNPVSSQGVGIFFQGSAGNTSNSVFLNNIGRQSGDPAGANNVGNAILITGSTNNLIGDVAKGNIIGSNGVTSDIVVDGATAIRNKITYNQFVCTGSFVTKGIELINSGNINFGNPSAVNVDMSSSGTITGAAPANSTVHVYSRAATCNQCLTATTGNFSRGSTLLGITTATAGGAWSFVTAQPASNIVVTATDANSNTSEFSYCFTPLGICPTAAAGPDQTICNVTTATLAGNDATTDGGVGTWSVISGTGLATSVNAFNSGVTNLTVGASTTFRWTVTKGGCATTTDDIIITVSAPVTSNAGSAQAICNLTTATLAGSNPAPGTGTWTRTAGTGSITSPSVFNSGVTGLTVGASSTFLWTVTNGACSANSSVIITVSSPVTSVSGPDQTICNSTTTTLAATVPAVGTGAWTNTGGTGTATTPSSATSGVTGLTVGASSAFQWTVTNGACSANSTVTIVVSAPVTSVAGSAQNICNTTTATLGATVPSPGSGAWTTTSGSGVATTPGSATSGVTGLTVGSASTFQWTVTNGACSANSSVTITVSSPITASTPTTQSLCNTTTANLSATTGTGTWSTFSGTGVATTPSSPTSGVTGLTVGATSVFEWTVTVGACSGVQESVSITVSNGATADAGTDIGLCDATSTTLGATGTGTWTTLSGTGIVTSPSNPTSGVTGLTVGETSVFQWSVSNGACSANATVDVVSTAPALLNAGADFSTCLNSFPLSALDPGLGYTGAWTSSNGSIVFTPANDPNAIITGLTTGLNTLTWTVTGTGNCAGPFTGTVNITFGLSDLTVDLIAPDDTACVGSPKTLVAKAQGGSGQYKYVWVSNLNFNNPVINKTTIVDTTRSSTYDVKPLYDRNIYWVIVIDKNNVGCASPLAADTVYASLGQDLNVPNLITPNEDGKNDYWVLKDRVTHQDLLPGSKFDLYNRWGERVFNMDNYDNRFNAPHISDGVYYYYVKSGCGDKEYKGWLQILGNNNP